VTVLYSQQSKENIRRSKQDPNHGTAYNTAYRVSGGMPGLQNMMRQLQQGAAGGLSNLMGGFGKS